MARYEDLMVAGRLAAGSKALQIALQPESTLQEKRLATGDDHMYQALVALRTWLSRLDDLPRESTQEPPPAVSENVRLLARALAVEQYVYLASGRVGAAIDSARDGLRLSYALKPDTVTMWLVSTAVDSLAIETVSKHLDQLSVRDCASLAALAHDWIAAPDTTTAMVEAARAKVQEQLLSVAGRAGSGNSGHVPRLALSTALQTQVSRLSQPDAEALWKRVESCINRIFASYLIEIKRPLWEQLAIESTESDAAQDNTLADQIAASLVHGFRPVLDQMMEARAKQFTRSRLLACHAAIRRYRWEHAGLPATLKALQVGEMATDPFTGEMFLYSPGSDEHSYTLASAGPPVRDDKGNIKQGERTPLALTQ